MNRSTIPSNVDIEKLTIENFQDLVGRRFRMTREQKTRGVSRETALKEYLDIERQARQTVSATPED